MSLTEKLLEISKIPLPEMQIGYAEDIKTFWHDFVEPRLPKKESVLAWHELLMRYVQDYDAVFVIRAFSNTNTNPRRGLLTQTDKDFSFTYSDNGFAKLIAKMVIDDFCPQYNEFKDSMHNGTMPISEFMGSEEKTRTFYKKLAQVGYAEYKLAHIVDSGKDFLIDGCNYKLAEICQKHFPAGEFDDWKFEENYYVRKLSVSSEARDVLIAYFLRYVDPLNYFLTPKPKNKGITYHTMETGIRDIAEYKQFQIYAMQQFHERYGHVYEEYLKLLKIPPELLDILGKEKSYGENVIKIHYGKTNVGEYSVYKNESEITTNTAEYRATRLTFKRDEIERLSPEGLIIIQTPKGIFKMTKTEFYETFPSVVKSKSYRENGLYNYHKIPDRAYKFYKTL
ncbi:MAG: hypothetical protein HDR51_05095 [Treponema sp.]|nr:hypothetical protein [Treponema sp.]